MKSWYSSTSVVGCVLLLLLTMLIGWMAMVLISLILYGDGSSQWILLPVLLGMNELIAAPLAIVLALVLRYAGSSTSGSLMFCHALLVLVFVLLGAGVLGKDNDLEEGSLMPIGVHAVLVFSIAWIGGAPSPFKGHGV